MTVVDAPKLCLRMNLTVRRVQLFLLRCSGGVQIRTFGMGGHNHAGAVSQEEIRVLHFGLHRRGLVVRHVLGFTPQSPPRNWAGRPDHALGQNVVASATDENLLAAPQPESSV